MRQTIVNEIKAAKEKGHNWTEYRTFLDIEEKMGAMVCSKGTSKGMCRKPAIEVSYCTYMGGRVTRCQGHKDKNRG